MRTMKLIMCYKSMPILFFITLLFISCEDLLLQKSCGDPNADNYDPDATIDDGSCIYGSANFAFGSITGDNIQILMDNI